MKDEFDSVSAAMDLHDLHEEKSRKRSKLVQLGNEARRVAEQIDEIDAKIDKILIELRKTAILSHFDRAQEEDPGRAQEEDPGRAS